MVSENWPNPLIKSSIPTIPLAIWMASAMISPSARKNLRPSGDLPRWPRYAWLHCSRWPASSSPPCSLATDRCAWTSKGSRKMQLCMSLINIERERFIYSFISFIYFYFVFIYSFTYIFIYTHICIYIYIYICAWGVFNIPIWFVSLTWYGLFLHDMDLYSMLRYVCVYTHVYLLVCRFRGFPLRGISTENAGNDGAHWSCRINLFST